MGLDLTAHRSQPLSALSWGRTDLILAMVPEQLNPVRQMGFGDVQIGLLGRWCRLPRWTLPDPAQSLVSDFRWCFALIDEAVRYLAIELRDSPAMQGAAR